MKYSWKNILLIIFLLVLPWQTRWIIQSGSLASNYWEYGTFSLYALDILVIIFAILLLINPKRITKRSLYLCIGALALLLINIFLSVDKNLALFHLSWLIEALIIFVFIKRSEISSKYTALSFALGASVSGLLGIVQFITQKTIAFKWLGLAAHQSSELGASVIEAVAPDGVIERWLRAYGTLDHPNMLGGLCALGLIALLYWALKDKEAKIALRFLSLIAVIGLSGGLILSFSRGAWLAALCGILILVWGQFKSSWKNLAPHFFIALFIALLCIAPYYYLFTPRFTTDSRLENKSIMERAAGYKESWQVIKEHPIVGSGLGNYGLALREAYPKELVWFYQPVHTVFLLIIAEIGIVGLILIILSIKALLSTLTARDKRFAWSLLAVLIVIGLFDHWLWSLHAGWLVIGTVFGLSAKRENFDS